MAEPIFDPAYWAKRLDTAPALYQSVFRCPEGRWKEIETKHRHIIDKLIGDTDSVLDVGCGYGRLLTLMPPTWCGEYQGFDLSPDMVALARKHFPQRKFDPVDVRYLPADYSGPKFDWAVFVSVRPMIIRNAGEGVWKEISNRVRRYCRAFLFLEYDPVADGEVETWR